MIDGAPALTTNSLCNCALGGVISIVDDSASMEGISAQNIKPEYVHNSKEILSNLKISTEIVDNTGNEVDNITDGRKLKVSEKIKSYAENIVEDADYNESHSIKTNAGARRYKNEIKKDSVQTSDSIAESSDSNIIKLKIKSGALTSRNDPDFKRRDAFAEMYYREILGRKRECEIKAVAKNSGFSTENIDKILSHVFEKNIYLKMGQYTNFLQIMIWRNLGFV